MKKYLTNSYTIWTIIFHVLLFCMLLVGGLNAWYGKAFGSLVFINLLIFFLMALKTLANARLKVQERWIIVASIFIGFYFFLPQITTPLKAKTA